MNKHLLLMTACAAALLATPVFAADDFSDITTKVTTPIDTRTAKNGKPSDIIIDSGGSVDVKLGSPAVTINSSNSVSVDDGGTISNTGTDNAIGVQLDATKNGFNGGFDNLGTIDLSGGGTGKSAVLVTGKGVFNGDITLGGESVANVVGDGSAGIAVASESTLNGKINVEGALTVSGSASSSTDSTSPTSGVVGINIAGNVTKDITIADGGSVGAIGQGAEGVALTGSITNGAFINEGTLTALGTSSPKANSSSNPDAGNVLAIGGSIDRGIYNAGPIGAGDATTTATITGTGSAAVVFISPVVDPTEKNIVVGVFKNADNSGYSFVNRGTISAAPSNVNEGATGVSIIGTDKHSVTLDGKGIFNSGTIAASGTTTASGQAVSVQAMTIGEHTNIPSIFNSAETGSGQITASVSGAAGGAAIGINIEAGTTAKLNSTLTTIDNTGTIVASATTTDTTVGTLNAYAIMDSGGSLTTITNSGTIAATATALDDPTNQHIVAADLSANTTGVTFKNRGTVAGDILFGDGNDVLSISGATSDVPASVTGNVDFGGTQAGGMDRLTVGQFGTLTGAVTNSTINGNLAVHVSNTGTLNLTNTSAGLKASTFQVDTGATLGLTVSDAFNKQSDNFTGALITADTVTLATGSKLKIAFGSFVPDTGNFILIDADTLNINNLNQISNFTRPFLYTGDLKQVTVGGRQELTLDLHLKTANQIGLTGNAAEMFKFAPAVLAEDSALGAAVVTNVTDKASAQSAFSAFAPTVDGATRAMAISLTDQTTGAVGARQRALRMYAGQDSEVTLWGQEFAQSLNQNSSSESSGFRDSGFGFVLGADGGDPSDGRYGGAFTFFSGDATDKQPRTAKVNEDWYMLTGYTDWRGKGFFLDTQVSGGYGNLKGTRTINLYDNGDPTQPLAFSRTANSKRSSLMAAGGVTTGVIMTAGSTVFTPQISFDGLTLREDGYKETGGGGVDGDGFDLTVNPYYTNSLRGYVGTSVREDLNLGSFFLQPEARIGWRYDFLSGAQKIQAAFAAAPTDTFSLAGPDPARGNIVGGGSVAVTTGDWSIALGYDFQRGTNGSFNQQGLLTLVGKI
ncbi:MAG TPA: autotransporter domain-containing protein [Rhizomicrobium sp.]|nr:autotransporter domain-containing protein [Rhizomicrobium sp.]